MGRIAKSVMLLVAGAGCSGLREQGFPPAVPTPAAPTNLQRMPEGVLVRVGDGFLKL